MVLDATIAKSSDATLAYLPAYVCHAQSMASPPSPPAVARPTLSPAVFTDQAAEPVPAQNAYTGHFGKRIRTSGRRLLRNARCGQCRL